MRRLTQTLSTVLLLMTALYGASAQTAPQQKPPPKPIPVAATAAQTPCVISGQVLDSVSGKGVEFATVAITDTTGRILHMVAADGSGRFSLPVKWRGALKLSMGSVGYTAQEIALKVDATSTKMDVGTHTLVAGVEVKEVVVAVQKPLVTSDADKLTYSVESDPESKTSSVLDIMRKIPQLSVDGEDNVLLNGQSDYKVLVNGKNSSMYNKNFKDIVRSLPANSIKDIEVITNPSTKYEAEGVGGIINIITTRKVPGGYTGSLNAGYGSFDSYNAGGYFSTSVKKLTLSARYNYGTYGQNDQHSLTERTNYLSDHNYLSSVQSTQNGQSQFHNGSLEASYEIDSLNLLTLSFWTFQGRSPMDGVGSTEFWDKAGMTTRKYTTQSDVSNEYGGLSGSLDYQRLFKKPDRTLTFSYKLETNPSNSKYTNYIAGPDQVNGQPNLIPPSQRSWNDAMGSEHTMQLDFFNPITKKHQMEAGFKYILRLNTSESESYSLSDDEEPVWVPIPAYVNNLDYTQHIIGAYGGYLLKLSKVTFKAGFRAEGTINDGKVEVASGPTLFDNRIFNIVPYVNMAYQLSKSQNVSISYTQRLRRPSIWYLNPYVDNQDPMNISYGNPNLKATISHTFAANYRIFSQKWNLYLGATAALSDNAITQYKFVNPSGVSESTYDNIGEEQRYGLNGSFSYRVGTKFSVNVSARGNYLILEAKQMDLKNEGFSYGGNVGVNVGLWKNGTFRANGGVFSQPISLQGSGGTQYYNSFGLAQQLFKKKVDVSVNIMNPFEKRMSYTNTSSDATFYEYRNSSYIIRRVFLNVNYRFGKMQTQVKKARRTVTNDDKMEGGGASAGPGGGQ